MFCLPACPTMVLLKIVSRAEKHSKYVIKNILHETVNEFSNKLKRYY